MVLAEAMVGAKKVKLTPTELDLKTQGGGKELQCECDGLEYALPDQSNSTMFLCLLKMGNQYPTGHHDPIFNVVKTPTQPQSNLT